jgi:tetratricopeptide (TPR) repeat protein
LYIRRPPLGEGKLGFRKRRPTLPYWRLIFYLSALAAALYVYLRMDYFQPRVLAQIGPPPTATPSAQMYADWGYEAYMQGDLAIAAEHYRMAASVDPTNVEYPVEQARLLVLDNRLEEGLAVAEQAILQAPEQPGPYAVKAMALDWMGRPDEAVIAALQAIEIDPNHAPAHAYLAEAYTDLGRWTQAREQAELAVSLDPYDVDARRDYAYVLEFMGDYEGAVQQYQQALALHPNLLHLLYGLARNYRGAGQTDLAVQTFQEIIERTPDDPQPYTELGRTYFELREDAAAQEYLEQAVDLVRAHNQAALEADPNAEPEIYVPAWTRLGMVYFTRRNYESAIEIFEEAIQYGEKRGEPIPLEAYYVTGAAYFYLDECTKAVPLLFRALELNEEGANDPLATDNVLRGLVLCRDYADHPVALQFPEGYEEPEVVLERPGQFADEGEPQSDEEQ